MKRVMLVALLFSGPVAATPALQVSGAVGYDDRPHLRIEEPQAGDTRDPSPIGRLALSGRWAALSGESGDIVLRPAAEALGAGGSDPMVLLRGELAADVATAGARPWFELSGSGRVLQAPTQPEASYFRESADAKVRFLRETLQLGLAGYVRARQYPNQPVWDFSAVGVGPFARVPAGVMSLEAQYYIQDNDGNVGRGNIVQADADGLQHIVRVLADADLGDALSVEARYTFRLAQQGQFEELARPTFGPGGEPDEDADEVSGGGFTKHAVSLGVTWLATDAVTVTGLGEVARKSYEDLVSPVNSAHRTDLVYGAGIVGRYAFTPELAGLLSAGLRGNKSTDPARGFNALSATMGAEVRF